MAEQEAPEKRDNTRTDEELLAIPEEQWEGLSGEEIDRLDILQKEKEEKGEEKKPEEEKGEGEKKEEEKEEDTRLEELSTEKKEEEEVQTVEELKKRKGWKDDDQVARSYVQSEKHMREMEREVAELKKGKGEQDVSKLVEDKIQEILKKPKTLTPEEVETEASKISEKYHSLLFDPATTSQAIEKIVNVAVAVAEEKAEKKFAEMKTDKEKTDDEKLKEEALNEREKVIEGLNKDYFNGEKRAKAEILFKNLTPKIQAKYDEHPELAELPNTLNMIASQVLREEGVSPKKKTKTTIDTGEGRKGKTEEALTSQKVLQMTQAEKDAIPTKDLNAAIEAEKKLQ